MLELNYAKNLFEVHFYSFGLSVLTQSIRSSFPEYGMCEPSLSHDLFHPRQLTAIETVLQPTRYLLDQTNVLHGLIYVQVKYCRHSTAGMPATISGHCPILKRVQLSTPS